jgi:hypothetical protein
MGSYLFDEVKERRSWGRRINKTRRRITTLLIISDLTKGKGESDTTQKYKNSVYQ